jgi:hypothetical protein
MASGTATKCPNCGRSIPVGLVSQTLLPHESKNGERCKGSGQAPATTAASRAAAARKATSSSASASATRTTSAPKRAASPAHNSLTVRRVEVDPEELARRQQKQEELRQARAEAARERNEIHVSYFDEPRP